jgi:hypothetical protein
VTDEELRSFSGEHLFYELEMVFSVGPLAMKYARAESLEDQVIKNALIESFAIHVRVLKAFFYDAARWPEDVTAVDYVSNAEEWILRRGNAPDVLETAAKRASGETAHLTTRRRSEPEAKHWAVQPLLGALTGIFCRFVSMTPKARLDWRIYMLASDLGFKSQEGSGEDNG